MHASRFAPGPPRRAFVLVTWHTARYERVGRRDQHGRTVYARTAELESHMHVV